MRIYSRHLIAVKFCTKGLRYYAKRHKLDLKSFIDNGIEEEELLAIGDYYAIALINYAHKEHDRLNGVK